MANNVAKLVDLINEKNENVKIIIVLLPELLYKDFNTQEKTMSSGKEIRHQKINAAIKGKLSGREDVYFLDVNKYIVAQADYFDSINHYSKLVYYKMVQEFVQYINSHSSKKVNTKPKAVAFFDNAKRQIYKKFFSIDRGNNYYLLDNVEG